MRPAEWFQQDGQVGAPVTAEFIDGDRSGAPGLRRPGAVG